MIGEGDGRGLLLPERVVVARDGSTPPIADTAGDTPPTPGTVAGITPFIFDAGMRDGGKV